VQDCGTFEHWVKGGAKTVGPVMGGMGMGMIGGVGVVVGLGGMGVF